MIYNIKRLKTLKKFDISNILGFTTKINTIFKNKNTVTEYIIPTNLKILKTVYNIKIKKLKKHFNKFLFSNLYNFFKILKLRLDFILFNFNLFLTIHQAKQNISHKHILINNKIARKSSYCVKNNDIIHLYNIPNFIIKKRLIYNYIIKNIDIYTLNTNVYETLLLYNDFRDIILNINTYNFNNILCNKNFKIKINKNNLADLTFDNYINND